MKEYIRPEIEVTVFEVEDVITLSEGINLNSLTYEALLGADE